MPTGTVLTPDASTPRGWDETAWADSSSGCSAFEAKPTWQTDTGCSFALTGTPADSYPRDTGLGMNPGSSPSITALADGTAEIAFQSNAGHLYLTDPGTGVNLDTSLGMKPGTSPSIAA